MDEEDNRGGDGGVEMIMSIKIQIPVSNEDFFIGDGDYSPKMHYVTVDDVFSVHLDDDYRVGDDHYSSYPAHDFTSTTLEDGNLYAMHTKYPFFAIRFDGKATKNIDECRQFDVFVQRGARKMDIEQYLPHAICKLKAEANIAAALQRLDELFKAENKRGGDHT